MNLFGACALSIILIHPFENVIAGDAASQESTMASLPYVAITFKGGAFHRMSQHWLAPSVGGASQTFGTWGFALESRHVMGALIGVGVERSLNRWEETASFDGHTRQRITTWSMYGELGIPLWDPLKSKSEGWLTFDAGKLWAIEEKTLDGYELDSPGSGSIVRLKFIGAQELSRHFSVGFEAGWQIANPAIEYKWFDEYMGDSLGANNNLKLSGPLLEARVTISGP